MDKKGNDPLREEFRSSQVYNVLKGSGIPVAGKIADGLDKATQGLDQVVSGFASGVKSGGGNQNGHPYQPSQRTNGSAPSGQGTSQTGWGQPNPSQGANYQAPPNTPPYNGSQTGNGYYHYSYTQNRQTRPPQQTAAQGQPRQAAAQGQPRQAAAQGQLRQAAAQGQSRQAASQGQPRQAAAQGQPRQTATQGQPRQTRPPQAPVYRPPQGKGYPQGAPVPQVPMKMVRQGSPAKFYITGAVALAYALMGPLYEPRHFVIFAVVLVAVFLISGALFRGRKVFVPIEPEKPKEEPKPQPEKEEKSQTGNPEVDKIIDEGREYLKKLRAADDAIPDEALSECITRMERASSDIFRYIGEHPEKAPQIRKFMNYYLPTTLKLLNSYQRLSSQSVKGENITSTMFNIAGMMHTVADAFEKQLDALFSEEAMDISADITVFETLLKQEGFVDEEKKEPSK